jgi:hypothetical protein
MLLTRFLLTALGFCLLSPPCLAEVRWCSITRKASTDNLLYPPIARAAHVTGVVVSRMTFATSGRVVKLETISGPVMLANAVREQLSAWTITTDAPGDDLCESLIVVEFSLGDSEIARVGPQTITPGIYRIAIRAEPLVLSDPASTIVGKRRWLSFKRRSQ